MKRLFATLAVMALAPASFAQSISLTAGNYAWDNDWGCSDLSIGTQMAYSFDGGCDGTVDYAANSVTIDGNRILIDDAYLEIEAADAQQISGIFHFNGANPAVFIRE